MAEELLRDVGEMCRAIIAGYANPDITHADYRAKVCVWAEDVLEKIAALPRTGEPVAWRDISTAPKDGSNIIAYDDGAVTVVYWDDARCDWFYPYKGGKTRWTTITHWRPLPAPPLPEQEAV